jgi:hypothetical protein
MNSTTSSDLPDEAAAPARPQACGTASVDDGAVRLHAAQPQQTDPVVRAPSLPALMDRMLRDLEARAVRAEQLLADHQRHCICRAGDVAAQVTADHAASASSLAGSLHPHGCARAA